MQSTQATYPDTKHHLIADLHLWFGRSLRFLLPIGCSALLLSWLFHKVNFGDMMHVIHQGVDYRYIMLMLLFNILSYMIRGTRWGLQLQGVGLHVPQVPLWISIFGAYSLNLLFSGFGEAWRCLYMAHRSGGSLSSVVGTDLGDRLSDLIVVILIGILALFVADSKLIIFADEYKLGYHLRHFLDEPWLWMILIAFIGIGWTIFHFRHRYHALDRVEGYVDRMWQGLVVIVKMRYRAQYLWLTLGIWICYFMQTYICFYAFPFTRSLITPALFYGLLPGLIVLLFGSLSMAVPSSGGLGPWNLAVIFALSLYGVNTTDGTAYAMLLWSAEALLQVILGLISLAYIAMHKTHSYIH